MTKNRRGRILAWLVRVYLFVLVGCFAVDAFVTPLLIYPILPLYTIVWLMSLAGLPGLQDSGSTCLLDMCEPNAYGWVAASLTWLSVFYALAWIIDTVLPKPKAASHTK